MSSPSHLFASLQRRSSTTRPFRIGMRCGVVGAFGIAAKILAASIVWDGDTNISFKAGGNWTGGTAPANSLTADTAVFNDPTGIAFQPTLDADQSILGLNFTAAGWTLGGTSTLTLGNGGITTAGAGITTINANITQGTGTTATWNLGMGSTLVLNGTVSLNAQPVITGSGNFVKGATAIGVGSTTTMSGNNTYTGTTTIRQGTIALTTNVIAGQNGAFGNATSAVIMGDSGTLNAASSNPQNSANVILLFNGAGATLFSRDINATDVTGGGRNRIAVSGSGAANVEVSGNITYATSSARRFEVGAAAGKTLTFSGIIQSTAGTSALLVNGSNYGTGTIRFTNAANNYAGGTTVVNGFLSLPVTVVASGVSAIGTGSVVLGEGATPSTVAGGGGQTTTIGLLMETGGTSFNRSVTLSQGATYQFTTGTPPVQSTHTGVINAYVVGGSNTSGTVTYTGNINSPTLAAGDTNLNLRAAGGGSVSYTGVINDNGDGTRVTLVNINQVVNLDTDNSGPGTTNGSVFGGTVILAGANTYQGGTYVRGGVALANNTTGSATGTGAVNVLGGTFGGTGSVSGTVAVSGGAALAPGNFNIESLSTGSLSMEGDSKFTLEINTTTATADLLAVNGDVTLSLAGDVVLDVTDLGNVLLAQGTVFTFLTYTGTYNGGLFAVDGNQIADDTGTFTVGQNAFHIDYNHNGNSVALVSTAPVPEPGSLMLMAGGLGMWLGNYRRRIKR